MKVQQLVRHAPRTVFAGGALVSAVLLVMAWMMRHGEPQSLAVGPAAAQGQDAVGRPDDDASQLAVVGEPRVAASAASVPATTVLDVSAAAPLTTINGRVVTDTGEPIEGAEVTTRIETDGEEDPPELKAISDAKGAFVLEGREPSGTYWVKATWKAEWFLDALVKCTPEVAECKLVFRQGGGIRGQVIGALNSNVEDYIVVARYEQAPIEWTPESRARFQSSLERSLKRAMRAEMHMQAFRTEAKSESRPDGEAWTLLQPDGRFELVNVRPGRSSVIIAARNRTRGLTTVAGVEVLPSAVSDDSRLNPVDLRPHACVYDIHVRDAEGLPIAQGALEILPVERDGPGKFTVEFKDGAATFIGPLWIDQVSITADGYEPLVLRGPKQSIRVTLLSQ